MYCDEELQVKFYEKYLKLEKKGLKEFINIIHMEDSSLKADLEGRISENTEIIWYPGCGGDVSPCSILERKKFEDENSIATNHDRIYLFTDPDQYRKLCEAAFGEKHKIYDRSVSDYANYRFESECEIYIEGDKTKKDEIEKLIEGHYIVLSLGEETCHIIYLNVTMQNFLFLVVKPFKLNIKWLFFLNMESKGGKLLELFYAFHIQPPQWICANRISDVKRRYADFIPMKRNGGDSYYREEESKYSCHGVEYGRMRREPSSPEQYLAEEISLAGLLKEMNVLCRDNGKHFDKENCFRIDVINGKLAGTDYKIENKDIFILCHKKAISEYGKDTILISTHIDCKQPGKKNKGITECFSNLISDDLLKGTYDNSITNTAVLYLMMHNKLPDNVIVAFTGDEERHSCGAIAVTEYLRTHNIPFKCIILDVTDAGWEKKALFTVENNFFDNVMGKKVIETVKPYVSKWLFVPEELYNVPAYVPKECVHDKKSEQDESWDYDELEIKCFSLCLPVKGDMHSDDGVYARLLSLKAYVDVLQELAKQDYWGEK